MRLFFIVFVCFLLLASIACSNANGDGNDSTSTPVVVSEEGIAEVLTRFSEAFVNNNQESLKDFWNRRTCDSKAVAYAERTSEQLDELYKGNYHLEVGAGFLVTKNVDGSATVPIVQPVGTLEATVWVQELEQHVPVNPPLPFEADILFAYDDGGWKVTNCAGLFPTEPEDESPSGIVTVTPSAES